MRKLDTITFHADRGSNLPISVQLADHFRNLISSGDLHVSTQLPSTRSLASDLGLSRSTVVAAYEQLSSEGFLNQRVGAGHFVATRNIPEFKKEIAAPNPGVQKTIGGSFKGPRLFQPCAADGRLFPFKAWARTISRVARRSPASLVSLEHPFGDFRLREAIAAHVAEWRGISAHAEQIIVTAGTGDAVRLILEVLAKPEMTIGLENPGYLPVRHMVSRLGLSHEWLSIDGDGATLPSDRCNIAVLTPSFQFPLGGAMPLERRSAYLAWANRNNSWIVEDDYDSEFRYGGRPIPAMAGLDRGGRTIYVGTFSKTFSPDIRIGYLIVPDDLMDLMISTFSERPSNASMMPQRVLAEFIEDGAFHRHLRRVRRHYAQRRDVLLDLVEGTIGPQPQARAFKGGMQIAVEMPHEFDDRRAALLAGNAGLGPEPLSKFDVAETSKTGLLIGFCAHSPEEMKDGFPSLARLWGS